MISTYCLLLQATHLDTYIKYGVFSQFCTRLGWKSEPAMFNFLPMVISGPDGEPKLYEIPEDIIKVVKITHPT